MNIEKIKDFIQPANINFLIGSGLSYPYLSTLGNIEKLLTDLSESGIKGNVKSLIKGSIYKAYFEKVMLPNLEDEKSKKVNDYSQVIANYSAFLETWNQIILNRGGSLLPKQVNIYTTNIDTFVENSAEQCKIEFNDGFKGSVNPIFDEGNFQKSYIKTSVHFQNSTELPVFNLLKMHGSINWIANINQQIVNDHKLSQIIKVKRELDDIESDYFINLKATIDEMKVDAETKIGARKLKVESRLKNFFEEYQKLITVNPTKRKFSETVLDIHFYDLMRMFSNTLEKENSLLFVMGFSFADEHILSITERATRTNPTLLIIIFTFTDAEEANYKAKFGTNNNIIILTPSKFSSDNQDSIDKALIDKIDKFDFQSINKVFDRISKIIPVRFNYGK